MQDLQRKNYIPDNNLMELKLDISHKNGTNKLYSFVDYRVSLEKGLLVIRINEVEGARIPLKLIKDIHERIASKLVV